MANTPTRDVSERVAIAAERIHRLIRRRYADGRQDRLAVFVQGNGAIHALSVEDKTNLPRVPVASLVGVYDHGVQVDDLWTDIEWFMHRHRDPARVQRGVFVGRLLCEA